MELLADARVALLTERRVAFRRVSRGAAPAVRVRTASRCPAPRAPSRPLPAKTTFDAPAGAAIRLDTPGGGGWGEEGGGANIAESGWQRPVLS